MDIIPAIDLLDGKYVRLVQGDFDQATVYGSDPQRLVRSFVRAGASRVHVVDLDAARDAEGDNRGQVEKLVRVRGAEVQVAGGIRKARDVKAWLDQGAARVVVGTLAVENPAEVQRLAGKWPGRVMVALDVRGEMISTHGWTASAGMTVREMVDLFEAVPLGGFIYTDIERDGTLGGPDSEGLKEIIKRSAHPVILSGGVTSLADLRQASAAGASGVIIGRALYEATLDLALAVAEFADGTLPN